MTDERYMWWKSEIADARASGDTSRLEALQLDYNLELGECLAHQSQRTKDIKASLADVMTDVSKTRSAVVSLEGRIDAIEPAMTRMADSVSSLANSVNDLITYRRDMRMKAEGARAMWRTIRFLACGVAVLSGWAYAIYQAIKAYAGR